MWSFFASARLPLYVFPFFYLAVSSFAPSCKPIPGDKQWPSQEAWDSLNQTISGRLIRPIPPGAVCHQEQPYALFDEDVCEIVRARWTNWDFQTNDLVSTGSNNWSNDTCLPYPEFPCTAAGYPAYVINATSSTDVQAGVLFANKHALRLVVHSTGHDLLGRSNAPHSLSINTHHLKEMKLQDSFVPQGRQQRKHYKAVTLGAGSQMSEVYSALADHNLVIVGGSCETVSLGGYLTGGGYGALTPWLGLAVDQILEVEVVLPNGHVVIANSCQNQDLFWAIRGGGGSTFGVLISATVKTFPSPSFASVSLIATASRPYAQGTSSLVAYILSQFPYFASHNMSGALFGGPSQTTFTKDPVAAFSLGMDLMGTENQTLVRNILKPVEKYIQTHFTEFNVSVSTSISANWMDYYMTHKDNTGAGTDELVTSRLIDAEHLTRHSSLLLKAATALVERNALIIGTLVGGVGLANAERMATSVQPGWKTSILHLIAAKSWPALNQTAYNEVKSDLEQITTQLQALGPETGAYINEASALDPDWRRLYWGNNYERLVQVKRAVDPNDVFWCPLCAGNERFQEVEGRVCRVNK
ncbi:hypothetical protein TRIATDRAFT_44348 [Trichoderma atroviride IMI 206040]|uniref:FAD-binding PCMH-type domain-containing protein n=1 Tax=Hypocrea atroviridis (strain ATCC 20476 / IMI 206040) TaxID=452589 RepID=G9NP49_HYPAI|nr:uncharacterized protein TRIATDRAFT_44348 [Trichoderma atroviride IMI 206040]EHK47862.1 hypothetical protein TRIATDRAFT_44348 [Trichoderma atroviride IMI 206040]